MTQITPKRSVIHSKFILAYIKNNLKILIFENLKQLFVKQFWFQDKPKPETYTVEFVKTKQVTGVQSFFFFVDKFCF